MCSVKEKRNEKREALLGRRERERRRCEKGAVAAPEWQRQQRSLCTRAPYVVHLSHPHFTNHFCKLETVAYIQ